MEFYANLAYARAVVQKSFNSQRDGILLYKTNIWKSIARVSIPNGMEFYESLSPPGLKITSVSIPNGMEFYLHRRITLRPRATFQFPTGWNSTISIETFGFFDSGFNSQRDGILPKSRGGEAR